MRFYHETILALLLGASPGFAGALKLSASYLDAPTQGASIHAMTSLEETSTSQTLPIIAESSGLMTFQVATLSGSPSNHISITTPATALGNGYIVANFSGAQATVGYDGVSKLTLSSVGDCTQWSVDDLGQGITGQTEFGVVFNPNTSGGMALGSFASDCTYDLGGPVFPGEQYVAFGPNSMETNMFTGSRGPTR